jgi:hypothetical protein
MMTERTKEMCWTCLRATLVVGLSAFAMFEVLQNLH